MRICWFEDLHESNPIKGGAKMVKQKQAIDAYIWGQQYLADKETHG